MNIDAIPALVWCALPDGSAEFFNRRWLDYAGLTAKQAKGWGWRATIHPEDLEKLMDRWRAALAAGKPRECEARLRRFDGEYRWFLLRAEPLCDDRGNIVKWYVTNTDIEELRRSEDALRGAQSELARVARLTTMGELAASIAHEVNQPLGAIVANGDAALRWLDRDRPDLDRVRASVSAMIDGANRGSAVIVRIRGLAKKSAPRRVPLLINDVIEEATLLMEREMLATDVSLRLELSSTLPPVRGDKVELQQVVINLIMNALEAMSPVAHHRRILTVSSNTAEADAVSVSVADTGVGLEPGTASHIFESFFTMKPDGVGMGLAICRSIIEAHGGRISVSGNAGPGATFQFTLPSGREDRS
jgi:PAS domain S-box-containing protein